MAASIVLDEVATFRTESRVPEINLHALQYGSATVLLASGVPDPVALIVMGHADVRMLRH